MRAHEPPSQAAEWWSRRCEKNLVVNLDFLGRYWEVIKDGHEVVARGVADTEPAACEQADEAVRKAKLIA
jgi:hypothetical protein